MQSVAQNKILKYVGLDVHAATIVAAVAEQHAYGVGEVRMLGTYPNTPEAVRGLIRKIGRADEIKVCYEAGPTGYGICRQLREMGVACEVIAPTLIPRRSGDRVKTDRRDAVNLAKLLRSGELSSVHVPAPEQESLRDLTRLRTSAKSDEVRHRHQLTKFLLRNGIHAGRAMTATACLTSAGKIHFDDPVRDEVRRQHINELRHSVERVKMLDGAIDEAMLRAPVVLRALVVGLQALRGVSTRIAVALVCELGTLMRFATAKCMMGFSGLVSSEYSSGAAVRRGGITKTGNGHVRTALVEAAWAYRHQPQVSGVIKRRQQHVPDEVKAAAWRAQQRLNKRYRSLIVLHKSKPKAVTAVARELAGFIWEIGQMIEAGLGRGDEKYLQMAEALQLAHDARTQKQSKATKASSASSDSTASSVVARKARRTESGVGQRVVPSVEQRDRPKTSEVLPRLDREDAAVSEVAMPPPPIASLPPPKAGHSIVAMAGRAQVLPTGASAPACSSILQRNDLMGVGSVAEMIDIPPCVDLSSKPATAMRPPCVAERQPCAPRASACKQRTAEPEEDAEDRHGALTVKQMSNPAAVLGEQTDSQQGMASVQRPSKPLRAARSKPVSHQHPHVVPESTRKQRTTKPETRVEDRNDPLAVELERRPASKHATQTVDKEDGACLEHNSKFGPASQTQPIDAHPVPVSVERKRSPTTKAAKQIVDQHRSDDAAEQSLEERAATRSNSPVVPLIHARCGRQTMSAAARRRAQATFDAQAAAV